MPAESATIGLTDRIFTRVGAVDDIGRGQSTFLVEMHETARILHQATSRSLVILDEIGRGTSTFDGLALAWAVAEYLHDLEGAGVKTLFATHYQELTELTRLKPRVKNFQVLVAESGHNIVFLHQMAPGAAPQSYGIQVAKLAGVPARGRGPGPGGSGEPGVRQPRSHGSAPPGPLPPPAGPGGASAELVRRRPGGLRDKLSAVSFQRSAREKENPNKCGDNLRSKTLILRRFSADH